MSDQPLCQCSFNPKVKTYWLLIWIFVSSLTVMGLPLLIITIPLCMWFFNKVLKAMSATLTERKLVVKKGIWFKVEKSIPLEKITDVAMSQGPLMRFLDIQQLSFETAGQSGAGALVSLIGIADAADFREAILRQKDLLLAKNTSPPPQSDGDSALHQLNASVQRIEQLLATLVEHQQKR